MHKDLASGSVRYAELDGLRGVAILLVVGWHYVIWPTFSWLQGVPRGIAQYFALSSTGVDLFFVLSGFLLGGILMDNREAPHFFKPFYGRRVCRIFPLYFLMLTLFFFGLAIPSISEWISKDSYEWMFGESHPWWSYMVFLQNFFMLPTNQNYDNWIAVAWSLAVEEQFYLVLPLLIWLVPQRALAPVLVGGVLMIAGARVALSSYTPQYHLELVMPFRADQLLLGVLCAWLIRQGGVVVRLRSNTKALYLIIAVLMGGGFLFMKEWNALFEIVGITWIGLLYALVLLVVITEKRGLASYVTQKRLLGELGIVSYAVYLFHQPVAGLLHGTILGQAPQFHRPPEILLTLTAFALTCVLSYASWVFFERKIVTWGRHYFRYWPGQQCRSVSSSGGPESFA